MGKKSVVAVLLFILAMLPALAAESDAAVDRAYKCVADLENKTGARSLQEAIFSTLALGGMNKSVSKLESDLSLAGTCWPRSGCTIKETAQASLAYIRIGRNVTQPLEWLLTRNTTASNLVWYLEVDTENQVPAQCSVSVSGSSGSVSIGADMKLTGNAGSCFSIHPNGYWLVIQPSCVGKEIAVSCDQGFVSTLLYQKQGGSTLFVGAVTHSAPLGGTTVERVSAMCFGSNGVCDYEGSLWAMITLSKAGKDVHAFVPYLVALAPDNTKYFPSAFLYKLTGSNDFFTELTQSQKQSKFWEHVGTPYNRYYDTALGMLGLGLDSSASELTNARNYLLNPQVQGSDGCWNNHNLRDSAFLLYAGWEREIAIQSSGGSGGSSTGTTSDSNGAVVTLTVNPSSGSPPLLVMVNYSVSNTSVQVVDYSVAFGDGVGVNVSNVTMMVNYTYNATGQFTVRLTVRFSDGTSVSVDRSVSVSLRTNDGGLQSCENAGKSCEDHYACVEAGGLSDDGLTCPGLLRCCNVRVQEQSCSALGGTKCSAIQQCSGEVQEALDGTCCLQGGSCEATPQPSDNSCEFIGGSCKGSCDFAVEEELSQICPASDEVCCRELSDAGGDEPAPTGESSTSYVWIIVLGILILLVVLGIVFRTRLQMMFFRKKGGSVSSSPYTRPSSPPSSPGTMGGFRPLSRPMSVSSPVRRPMVPASKPAAPKDKEMEDTLKKLKDISS